MKRPRVLLSCAFAAGLAGCAAPAERPREAARVSVSVEEAETWRATASPRDAGLIDAIDAKWSAALATLRSKGQARAIAARGALLEPGGALARAAPAPGPYRCRLVRIGAAAPRARPISVTGESFCFVGVEDAQLTLTSDIPSRRFGGYLWETRESRRLVFLGAGPAPGGRSPSAYGEDPTRDLAGRFERIGEFRYRLVLPAQGPETQIQLLELSAAPRAPA
jgi:hypothetical protein